MEFKHGQLISKELSNFLKEHSTPDNINDVFEATGVSISTVKQVVSRKIVLSELSAPAILELMKFAVPTCDASIKRNRQQLNEVRAKYPVFQLKED